MNPCPSLFLITEPSGHPSPAFETAGALAQISGASVHLCAFDHSEAIALVGLVDRPGMEKAREAFLTRHRASAQSLANTLEAKGIRATADVAWCRPAYEEMLKQITELRPDLVIKDVRYEPTLLKRVLMTPTDWHLARECPVPLMLVHGSERPLPARIVAAVDAGPHEAGAQAATHRIVRVAQELALRTGAELHLVFALSPTTDIAASFSSLPASLSADAWTAMLAMRTKAFERLAQEHGVTAGRRHVLAGFVGPAVADFATELGADVIVVGATHRRRLDRFVMGSTAEQIADHAPCSVMIVPPG